MAGRNLTVVINPEQETSRSDILSSDCLRVECTGKVIIGRDASININLTVHNTSSVGRMGFLLASFDAKIVSVTIPNPAIYVGPDSKTVVGAVIKSLVPGGSCPITFNIF